MVLGVNTCLVFTWMRKVVGSNLGDDNIRSLSSFVNRLKKGDCYETANETGTAGNDNNATRQRRSYSNQSSSSVCGAIYQY